MWAYNRDQGSFLILASFEVPKALALSFGFQGLVGNRSNEADKNNARPNQDKVAPSHGGCRVGKKNIGHSGGHIAYKINKSRCGRNHARVAEAGAIYAVKNRRRAVGAHNAENDEDNIEEGRVHKIGQSKENDRQREHKNNGKIPSAAKQLIQRDGNNAHE